MNSSSARARSASLTVSLAILVSACALPSDDSPQELTDPRIEAVMSPSSTTTTTTKPLTQTQPQEIFFYDEDGVLVGRTRDIPINASVTGLLSELARPPRSLTTNVPEEAEFDEVDISDEGILTITVPEGSALFPGGAAPIRTVAQIVVTATQMDGGGIEGVRFRTITEDGEAEVARVPSETRGDTNSTLTPCDYPSLLPDSTDLDDDCEPTSSS